VREGLEVRWWRKKAALEPFPEVVTPFTIMSTKEGEVRDQEKLDEIRSDNIKKISKLSNEEDEVVDEILGQVFG